MPVTSDAVVVEEGERWPEALAVMVMPVCVVRGGGRGGGKEDRG